MKKNSPRDAHAVQPERSIICRIVKLAFLFLFACSIHASAVALTQNARLSLHLKTVPLTKVFSAIEQQTDVRFVYSSNIIPSDKRVTVDVDHVTVTDILKQVLHGTGLDFSSTTNNLIVIGLKQAPQKKDRIIKGKIFDEAHNPVPGVNVMLKNLQAGCNTNANGEFTLAVTEDNPVLLISCMGFMSKTFTVGEQTYIEIILSPNISLLQQVVVTGYQTIAKERSAGSFTKVDGAQIQHKSGSMNVVDRLEGLVPGFAVNNSAGADKFLIRGVSSVNASRQPLFVVDNVPMSNDYIASFVNPNDVESITFLKDATAASIWGANAANGVVVITTKMGKTQPRRIKVNYDGFVSFKGLPDYSYQHKMNSPQFINAAKEVFNPAAYPWKTVTAPGPINSDPKVYPHEQVLYDLNNGIINQATANTRLDSLASLNNRGQIYQYLQQPALLTNHSLSFTGGSQFHSYYGSIAYTNQENNSKASLNRYMLNLRQDFIFSKNVKADITVNVSQQKRDTFQIPSLPDLNTYLPYAMLADAGGNPLSQADLMMYKPYRQAAEQKSGLNLDYYPLKESGYTSKNEATTGAVRVNTGLNIKLLKGLTYDGRFQYQQINNNAYTFYDQQSYQTRYELVHFTQAAITPGGKPTYYLPETGGQYQSSNSQNIAWTVRNQLMYDNVFKQDHQLTLLAGTEVRGDRTRLFRSLRRGFDFQTQTYNVYDEKTLQVAGVTKPVIGNNSATKSTLSSSPVIINEIETRFFSMYANGAYTYKQRYNLNGSIRMDQSNLFGTEKSQQYKPIWSVGAGWLISNEAFFDVKPVNRLNLRLTYGLGGNSPQPGSGSTMDIVLAESSPLFNGMGIGYRPLLPGNKMLSWERTKMVNAGIDFDLFKSRISGAIDVYQKKTVDLLGSQPLDRTAGWYYGYANLGDMINKGIDIQINSRNIDHGRFSWNTLFTLGYNKNKVLQLKRTSALTSSDKVNVGFVEGYPAYSFFAYKWAGLDGMGDPQVTTADGKLVKNTSGIVAADLNYAGISQPQWYGGITNTFRYRNFDLSFLVIYNLGYQMRRDVNTFYSGRLTGNIPVSFEDRWKQPGDETKTNIPSYVPLSSDNISRRSTDLYKQADINIVRADYMKLRDLTLAYNLPSRIVDRAWMESCRIYTQLNNVMLWKMNKDGIDPEYFNLMYGTRSAAMKPFFTVGVNVRFK
ncbi:TonB-linked SusC/RagA family outer membrane protein [Chitinophaga niastensis]|uniref:TonB-linked SusC/RagA family outer membrane protein n=1 Tax=Chitinophaga niastensis TaxID=536980 RepID=A0A2P8HLW1_CHINA|nr:SusC/RagA family TonB-linked outer membrane protein [Chitinophaga niastensis]PSL47204.1 TonB-linked SusC/RagA family outer membrane protein [Chitinophaga niastensis]